MANQTITQLPNAGPITGSELVPIVQNGGTYKTTASALAGSPVQTQTFLTLNQEPTLNNSRYLSVGSGLTLVDNGAQNPLRIDLTDAAASLNAAGNGLMVKVNSVTLAAREMIASTAGLSIADGDGIAGNPAISLTGQVLSLANASGAGLVALPNNGTVTPRSIVGTANQIDVVNGNAAAGNPTISISDNPVLGGTGGLTLPSGDISERPAVPNDGLIRFNTETDGFEGNTAAGWKTFGSGEGTVTSVNASGGDTGMSFSGGPITSSGSLTLEGTPTKATNLAGGATNKIPYQTAANTTGFIDAPIDPETLLKFNGTGFEWGTVPGTGTVTSVGVSGGTTGLTTTGGPITSSGDITLGGTLNIANGGTGATTQQAAINALAGAATSGQYLRGDGTNVTMSAIQAADVPTLNQNTTGTASNVTGIVAVANGGTGTDTPGLVAGTNVTISGSWPNQTIDASGGGGSGAEVGQVVFADDAPTTGTWLETGKYYSKAAYPDLAAAIGDVPDIGSVVDVPQAQLPQPYAASAKYTTATDGITTVAVGASGAIRVTTDGITWTGVPSSITTDLIQVKYLNGNFVAVSGNGTSTVMATSIDGLNWVPRATNANITAGTSYAGISSVAYGAGVYVAVGSGGLIQYSSNLVDWNASSSIPIFNLNLRQVIYSAGLFVAVGDTGALYTSPDGITWTSRSAGSSTFSDVIFANSLFVAVGASGVIYTSSDGITWTNRGPGATSFSSIIYGNGLFVATASLPVANSIFTSSDGITWANRSPGVTGLQSVVWNGSNFVAVSGSGFYATSADGIAWAVARDASNSNFYWVAVIASKTIAFGTTSSVVLAGAARTEVLQNGTWNYTVAAQSASNPRTIAYNGSNQYVVVGSSGYIAASSDGLDWVGQPTSVTTNFDKVQYVNGNYIIMGGSGSATNLLTSPDGLTWTPRTAGTAVYNAAAYGASAYVVVGASGVVYSSPDLATWTSRSAGAQAFNDVIFASGLFVAVGAAGACYSSPDGATWTTRSAGAAAFQRIIFANSLFVAVGATGTIRTSPDGVTWTARTSGVAGQLNDIVWSGSLFCAVGASGVITTSPDGITWTARTGDTSVVLNSVSWSGTRFIATNTTNAVVWTSTDAITWMRVATTYVLGNTLYSGYLGGKFLAIGSGFIQSSTDGINWTSANLVQYVPTAINKLYNLGGIYFALTDKGMFQSNDGVTFSLSSRSIRSGSVYSMAYSGSAWVALGRSESSQPIVFYKSTDGATWVVSSTLGDLAAVNTNAGTSIDIVYANGNFIFGTTITTSQNLDYTIYTSPDGVTWTGRQTPYLLLASNTLASDGSICTFVQNNLVCKSTDGGVTWSYFAIGGQPAGYVDGVWIFGSVITTNFSDFFSVVTGMFSAPYKSGNYIIGFSSPTVKTLSKIGVAGGSYLYAATQTAFIPSLILSYKPSVARGATLLLLVTRNNNATPNLLAEAPLYSYDTATTFFIPPVPGQGVSTYIYAGA